MPNIFISVDRHKPYVTAHEIGHALGVANWAFNHGYGSSEFWSSQSHVMNPDPIGDVDQVIASKRFPREQIMTMRNSPFARAK